MDEHEAREPLLSSGVIKKNTPFLVSSLKWALKATIWVVFVLWAAFIFLLPSEFVNAQQKKWIEATRETLFGINGSMFLLFSGPILVLAFLSIALLIISEEEELHEMKPSKCPSFRLWTFPVLVDGPFGVVSAAEFIGILIFFVYVIWAVSAYAVRDFSLLSRFHVLPGEESSVMLELTGLRFGSMGLFCLAFLFLPVARGSALLRIIDIPFEHATRYHVWLGHLTMFLFTLHGLFYIIAWAMQGRLIHEILQWKDIGIANLPGVISLSAGLFMWVTSLPFVRKLNFELFFYTHQLYVIFVVFLALHVGDFIFSMAAGGIFIFILDRFLRFCQSRQTVDIISATCLPCGTVELVLSKPGNLRYNALSFIFLQVRELSWLQWHPFSVSSSPLDGKHHLSVLIKVLGGWTAKLRKFIYLEGAPRTDPPFQTHSNITASVEGPYGHESPYHLTYENLILVAGGIGISPFLAILSDIFHRMKERKPCLPRNILIVWAVKRSDELPLLSTIDMESICPFYSCTVNLEIQIYVTREAEPPLEEGKNQKTLSSSVFPVSHGCHMSPLVGTGDNIWSGVYVVVSTVGFVIFMGLLNIYYIKPFDIYSWWYKGLLLVVCMVVSVCFFGGLVACLWNLWEKMVSAREESERECKQGGLVQHDEPLGYKDLQQENFSNSSTICYGSRPNFREIFGSISEHWGHVDIGVIVCGPPTLQSTVAKECRSQNLKRSRGSPIFHFNSHSFDL